MTEQRKIKTMEGWHKHAETTRGGDWKNYASPGDIVDLDVIEYFMNILPPKCMRDGYLQVGGPISTRYDRDDEPHQTYATFRRLRGRLWMFCGDCFLDDIWDASIYACDNIHDWLRMTYRVDCVNTLKPEYGLQSCRPRVECTDGYTMSIQAGYGLYSTPRENLPNGEYAAVEIGFPSEADDLIQEYAETPWRPSETVYPYVPIEILEELLKKHGGMKHGRETK